MPNSNLPSIFQNCPKEYYDKEDSKYLGCITMKKDQCNFLMVKLNKKVYKKTLRKYIAQNHFENIFLLTFL